MGDSEPPPIEGNCAEESCTALAARNQTAEAILIWEYPTESQGQLNMS
jgi:hypothetical protein